MKTALLVGGGLLALVIVWKVASASAVGTVATGTGTGTSLVPGSAGGGTGSSTNITLQSSNNTTVGGLVVARNVVSSVGSTVYKADKYVLTLGGLL